jgi:two-component system CheB/CheR fusion protein
MTGASAEGLPVVLLDRNLWVLSANRSFYQVFGVNRRDIRGRPICLLGDGQLNMHALLTLLESFVRQKAVVEAYEWETGIVGVGRRTMQVNVRKIVCNRETQARFVLVFEDIADWRADGLAFFTEDGERHNHQGDRHERISRHPL